ncbi:hypothetical protein [Planktothrix agardhii]|jgi:hypothetical protein|uniref:hypothetical protein n=1 Tax=Planktothrix agardhii TaxID=1160 RepID=UPI001F2D6318|nr:hypothetical protein [Planktothrix agardhii]MCF3578900.1 hypothetical protein [Planktothrix agardhii 1812]MCF3587880.1 hypothetical protein [Planktothrix agardhii 1803]
MRALTAIAATAYALTLWMFAPSTVWEREVKQAKQNQQTRPTATPEMMPQPKPEPIVIPETKLKSTQKAIPESISQLDTIPEVTPEIVAIAQPTPKTKAIEQAIPKPQGTDYTGWNITKLRDEAKTRKLNWRPLVDGKRKPLNKPQLIELLKT